ncbi:ribonuclease H1 small subunit [Polyplosphaeria fusca]|uniref:Ribonuclease H1 small subunit n=1 Tax=Polyplosphaeria fusca TaxID=682080 RepID=A0A9P4QP29_9PLEO|nr:ribonuclease H1 small subunit [Polyplosphaeria fusca]
MLSIQESKQGAQKCTPNLLPARLNHNGPVHDTERFWKPETDEAGKSHAYFRGRHLHGTPLTFPSNYTGAVLQVTDKDLPASNNETKKIEEDEDESEQVEVKIAEKVGEFDEVVVWGHGGAIDKSEDVYARGVEEWIGFAEALHASEDIEKPAQESK